MALPPPPTSEDDAEDWLTTYADAITLLMAFFVLFFSFSKVDLEVYDQVAAGLQANMAREDRKTDAKTLQENLKDVLLQEGAQDATKMGTDAQGSITMELDGGAFFKPGSADLTEQAIPVLTGIFEELNSDLYTSFNISIEGHTDDDPINTPRYPSNWELSANRASTVVRFFETGGMAATRLRAIGYGSTHPKVPNRDEAGAPIPENMIANRRVILRINRAQLFIPIKIPKFRRKPDGKKTEKKSRIN